jgi:hypothetical protein
MQAYCYSGTATISYYLSGLLWVSQITIKLMRCGSFQVRETIPYVNQSAIFQCARSTTIFIATSLQAVLHSIPHRYLHNPELPSLHRQLRSSTYITYSSSKPYQRVYTCRQNARQNCPCNLGFPLRNAPLLLNLYDRRLLRRLVRTLQSNRACLSNTCRERDEAWETTVCESRRRCAAGDSEEIWGFCVRMTICEIIRGYVRRDRRWAMI